MAKKTETYAVLTGPITGVVTLPDGREVNVTPAMITVEDQATADAVAHAVSTRYATEGHPTDPNFVYNHSED